jgi:hypothetical protein
VNGSQSKFLRGIWHISQNQLKSTTYDGTPPVLLETKIRTRVSQKTGSMQCFDHCALTRTWNRKQGPNRSKRGKSSENQWHGLRDRTRHEPRRDGLPACCVRSRREPKPRGIPGLAAQKTEARGHIDCCPRARFTNRSHNQDEPERTEPRIKTEGTVLRTKQRTGQRTRGRRDRGERQRLDGVPAVSDVGRKFVQTQELRRCSGDATRPPGVLREKSIGNEDREELRG